MGYLSIYRIVSTTSSTGDQFSNRTLNNSSVYSFSSVNASELISGCSKFASKIFFRPSPGFLHNWNASGSSPSSNARNVPTMCSVVQSRPLLSTSVNAFGRLFAMNCSVKSIFQYTFRYNIKSHNISPRGRGVKNPQKCIT